MAVDFADRPCKCDVCGKKFKRAMNLRRHMDVHTTTQKSFQCEVRTTINLSERVNQPPVNQLPVNKPPVNLLEPINKSPVNQPPVNQPPVNQLPVNQSPLNLL